MRPGDIVCLDEYFSDQSSVAGSSMPFTEKWEFIIGTSKLGQVGILLAFASNPNYPNFETTKTTLNMGKIVANEVLILWQSGLVLWMNASNLIELVSLSQLKNTYA